MDFKYKKSGTIFNMHSYWTKQPIDPIIYFIEKYTKSGDVVLDPFSGTGMTGIAAIQANRKAILNDLSPISIHISKGYCTNYNIQKNISKIIEVKNNILKSIENYYTTTCEKCSSKAKIRFSIVGEIWKEKDGHMEENRGEIMLNTTSGVKFRKDYIFSGFKLIRICYECHCTKGKQTKKPDNKDLIKWDNDDYKKYFFPTEDFFGQEPKRNYKKGIRKVYQLYSSRNLSALSVIFNRISKIPDADTKQLFLFVFSSILFNSSLMSRYRDYENTSIKMGTFYVPPLIKDTNVVSNFENKFKLIIKGNAEIFKDDYHNKVKFIKGSADSLKSVKSNSIDYIYADPPYSDIINYSELNIVFESWLGSKTDSRDEMIVSQYQKKNISDYSKRFSLFLNEAYRVLKKGSTLTLVFHHPNPEHWQHFQNVIINSKFDTIESSLPVRLISNSKTSSQHRTKKNSQCFLVFNLRKNEGKKNTILKPINNQIVKKIEKEARKNGYKSESDKFDYLINKLLFNYKIDPVFIR
jgi:DNA modification methylase